MYIFFKYCIRLSNDGKSHTRIRLQRPSRLCSYMYVWYSTHLFERFSSQFWCICLYLVSGVHGTCLVYETRCVQLFCALLSSCQFVLHVFSCFPFLEAQVVNRFCKLLRNLMWKSRIWNCAKRQNYNISIPVILTYEGMRTIVLLYI